MIFRFAILMTATLLVGFTNVGHCQNPTPMMEENDAATPKVLSIDEAVESAIRLDPKARQIHFLIESAEAERLQKTRRPNPTVGIVANEIGNDGQGGQWGAYMSRNLVRNQRFAQNHELYTSRMKELQCGKELRQLQIARDVSIRFLALARNNRQLQLSMEYLEALQEIKKIVDRLSAAGEIAAFSVTGIDLELESQRQKIAAMQRQKGNLQQQLSIAITGEADKILEFEFEWNQAVSAVSADQPANLLEQLLANHPEICQANAKIEQLNWQVELAKSQRCPDYKMQASVNFDASSDDFFAGFQLGIPLQVNDRKTGLIRSAHANLKASHERLSLIRRSLKQNVVSEMGNQQVYKNRLTKLEQTLLKLADQNLVQVRKAFVAGSASFLQLKEAIEAVQNAKLLKASLEYELLASQAKIETVTSDR